MRQPLLSELFISVICGMIDVEGRKRIASNGIEVLEKFFLYGALEIRQSNFKKYINISNQCYT